MSVRVCLKCGVTKPADEFKTYLTTAQAIARGYSGRRRIKGTSLVCKACRSARKYGKTKRQLDNEVTHGKMTEMERDVLLRKRQANANKIKSVTLNKRWRTLREAGWGAVLKEVEKEYRRADKRHKVVSADTEAMHEAETQFLARYVPMVGRTLTLIRAHVRKPDPALPPSQLPRTNPPQHFGTAWHDCLRVLVTNEEELKALRVLKARVPHRKYGHKNLESVFLALPRPKPPRKKPGRKPKEKADE
jgi:hypothetical protein